MEHRRSGHQLFTSRYLLTRLVRKLSEAEMRQRLDRAHSERFGKAQCLLVRGLRVGWRVDRVDLSEGVQRPRLISFEVVTTREIHSILSELDGPSLFASQHVSLSKLR